MTKIFVYGTLRQDGSANHLFQRGTSAFIKETRTHSRFHLYDIGHFPGIVEDESKEGVGVFGEVFECDSVALKALDRYESVDTGLFTRRVIELNDGSQVEAYCFTGMRPEVVMQECELIKGGKWTN